MKAAGWRLSGKKDSDAVWHMQGAANAALNYAQIVTSRITLQLI